MYINRTRNITHVIMAALAVLALMYIMASCQTEFQHGWDMAGGGDQISIDVHELAQELIDSLPPQDDSPSNGE